MIQSREASHRVAAPLPYYLQDSLRKRHRALIPDERTDKLQHQVEACTTTAARRLILGTSRKVSK